MIEFKKNLKILIFSLSIILFCNSNLTAAVSGLITEKDVTGVGNGHTDNYIIGIDYKSFDDKLYTISFKNYDFKFSHQRMLKKFNLNIDSNYNFFETNPEYGFYVRLSDQF